jgi:death-on-curing protein
MGWTVAEAGKVSEREPWSNLVAQDTLIDLHEESIARYKGEFSPPQRGCLERSLGAAWNLELYTAPEGARRCLNFCSGLLFYLIKNHCFLDGNKRIAWMAAMETLRQFGLTVRATDEEAEKFCKDIISGEIKKALDVVLWIEPRLEEFC